MPKSIQIPTTQRAYTIRLRGEDPKDQTWREYLWRTHEAVNKGTKIFGDWLLTMRGGLDHSLAKGKTEEETKAAGDKTNLIDRHRGFEEVLFAASKPRIGKLFLRIIQISGGGGGLVKIPISLIANSSVEHFFYI